MGNIFKQFDKEQWQKSIAAAAVGINKIANETKQRQVKALPVMIEGIMKQLAKVKRNPNA